MDFESQVHEILGDHELTNEQKAGQLNDARPFVTESQWAGLTFLLQRKGKPLSPLLAKYAGVIQAKIDVTK